MPAYLIADVHINDEQGYERYRSRTAEIVEAHCGRFLVRGGAIETLEGDPDIERLIVIEFPSVSAARMFYDSDEYQAIMRHRTENARTTMFIADGGPAAASNDPNRKKAA